MTKRIAKIGYCQLDNQLGHSYIVPDETLSSETAACLGIRIERSFFGGIVPHEFVATKAITHSLCGPDAASPDGFSRELGDEIKSAVLPGYTVFSEADIINGDAFFNRPAVGSRTCGSPCEGYGVQAALSGFAIVTRRTPPRRSRSPS